MVEQASRVDVTVLIQGESGTGKTLAARIVHEIGARARGPFVHFDCALVARELIKTELFGSQKPSPAAAREQGVFHSANDGTLFLEHIELLPPSAQGPLLHAMESDSVIVEGTSMQSAPRVIAATVHPLERLVITCEFREDLFYRLNVVRLEMPPLRERGVDAVILSEQLLAHACARLRLPRKDFTTEAREALIRYPWPGNVEELRDKVERAALSTAGPEIDSRALGIAI